MSQGIVRATARHAMTTDSWEAFIDVGSHTVWRSQQIWKNGPEARSVAEARLQAALEALFDERVNVLEMRQEITLLQRKVQELSDQINGGM
jgi:hypothetical protein